MVSDFPTVLKVLHVDLPHKKIKLGIQFAGMPYAEVDLTEQDFDEIKHLRIGIYYDRLMNGHHNPAEELTLAAIKEWEDLYCMLYQYAY